MSHLSLSHRAKLSGEFGSRKDLQSTKFERRPRIFVKLSLRELCDSKLSGSDAFDSMAIILEVILKVIFVTLTENSYDVTNETQGPQKYLHHWK